MNREKLNDLMPKIDHLIRQLGVECIELDWAGSSRTLTVYIDFIRQEGLEKRSVSFEECGKVTKILRDTDEIEVLNHLEFVIEVSSPGLERPLRRAEDFWCYIGETVSMKLFSAVGNLKSVKGLLIGMDDKAVKLTVSGEEIEIKLENIKKCNLVCEWNT